MVESYETESYTGEDMGNNKKEGSYLQSLQGSCFLDLKTCTFAESPQAKVCGTQRQPSGH